MHNNRPDVFLKKKNKTNDNRLENMTRKQSKQVNKEAEVDKKLEIPY